MKQMAKQLIYSVASLLMVLGLAVVPVSAEHGSDDSNTSTATTPIETDDSSASNTSSNTTTETETESTTEDSGHQSGKLRSEAAKLLSQERQNAKEHSQADRQKACTQRQNNINRRTAQFAANAARHLEVFNKIFTKVQAFHDSKGLQVSDYDALVAAATAKQTAAQTAVDALKALNVQIDCTQPDPASTVATIKSAVTDARTALQAYRTSLKDLVVALKGASTAQHTTDTTENTGGNQ
ncbi:MAG TPA: hypothetical protein VLF69_03700 [Candidatus Saccharimonadales bacterium]|nr:hypothetical protein [Candidatus Saccharimonadales bacterium]